MANYKPDLSCQSKFIPIDFLQQISPGTFEYALAHIVDNYLNLTGFEHWYHNDKGMNKFTLRGQEKVNTEWQLFCLVHNIEKLRNSLH
jgi:hypothetical protein